MNLVYSPKNNPRVIVIQKLYGKQINKDEILTFPKHRFKKFIKDVVNGTIERDEVIKDEISNHLNTDLDLKKLDKVFQVIIKSAIFEFLYKPKISSKIIINRSEEHTSELQSLVNLVCRLLLEKKKQTQSKQK